VRDFIERHPRLGLIITALGGLWWGVGFAANAEFAFGKRNLAIRAFEAVLNAVVSPWFGAAVVLVGMFVSVALYKLGQREPRATQEATAVEGWEARNYFVAEGPYGEGMLLVLYGGPKDSFRDFRCTVSNGSSSHVGRAVPSLGTPRIHFPGEFSPAIQLPVEGRWNVVWTAVRHEDRFDDIYRDTFGIPDRVLLARDSFEFGPGGATTW
jgi:hypothetical protein